MTDLSSFIRTIFEFPVQFSEGIRLWEDLVRLGHFCQGFY